MWLTVQLQLLKANFDSIYKLCDKFVYRFENWCRHHLKKYWFVMCEVSTYSNKFNYFFENLSITWILRKCVEIFLSFLLARKYPTDLLFLCISINFSDFHHTAAKIIVIQQIQNYYWIFSILKNRKGRKFKNILITN